MYLLDVSASAVAELASAPAEVNKYLILLLVISMLTPWFLAWMNHRHEIKMKRIELLFKTKQEAYLDFSKSYYSFSDSASPETFRVLEESANKCRLLCRDKDFDGAVKNLLTFVNYNPSDSTSENFFTECLNILHRELKSEEKYFT